MSSDDEVRPASAVRPPPPAHGSVGADNLRSSIDMQAIESELDDPEAMADVLFSPAAQPVAPRGTRALAPGSRGSDRAWVPSPTARQLAKQKRRARKDEQDGFDGKDCSARVPRKARVKYGDFVSITVDINDAAGVPKSAFVSSVQNPLYASARLQA